LDFFQRLFRTFYYRTWHKISKYIQFPEALKKSTRELYGLINFGVLRKKLGNNLDWKKGAKLGPILQNSFSAEIFSENVSSPNFEKMFIKKHQI
jgi:hypothetical protein